MTILSSATSQPLSLVPTLLWVAAILFLFGTVARRSNRLPVVGSLGQRSIAVLFYLAVMILAVLTMVQSSVFTATAGIALLVFGLALSYEPIFRRTYQQAPLGFLLAPIPWALGLVPRVAYRPLLGDLVQLAGFSLLWNPIILVPAIALGFPLIEITFRITAPSGDQKEPDSKSTHRRMMAIWPGNQFVARLIVISLMPALLASIATGQIRIFSGSIPGAVVLLTTLIEIEATVGAVLVAFLLLTLEVTSSAYSPRLTPLVLRRGSFARMLGIAITSIGLKILFIAVLAESITDDLLFIIDGLLLLTVASLLGYFGFARDALYLLPPENIVREGLTSFDESWMRLVRQEWSSRFGPRSLYLEQDPLVLIERVLVSSLDRGDLNSFKAALILLRDRFEAMMEEDDGGVIDSYLDDRFSSVIQAAYIHNSEAALVFLCEAFEDITHASKRVLESAEITSMDPPPGTKLFRAVLAKSIPARMPEASRTAANVIGRRADRAFEALPKYSDLWLITEKVSDESLSDEERQRLWRNDWRLDGYVEGFLDYLSEIAVLSIKHDLGGTAWSCSHSISQQVTKAVEDISEERYQFHLLHHGLAQLVRIAKTVSESTSRHNLALSGLGLRLRNITNPNTALLISSYLADIVVRLARAGSISVMTVIDLSVASSHLARCNPEAGLIMIAAFGNAGGLLNDRVQLAENEELLHARSEIHRRIDQIEHPSLQHRFKTKVRKAAKLARMKSE